MEIEEVVSVLKNHMEPWASHLMSKYDREATAQAITYLERLKRLEELLEAENGYSQTQLATDVLHYLKTGEETGWWVVLMSGVKRGVVT